MTPADFRAGRLALGLSRPKLATILDVSPAAIVKWEAPGGTSARAVNPLAARVLAWMLAEGRPADWPEPPR